MRLDFSSEALLFCNGNLHLDYCSTDRQYFIIFKKILGCFFRISDRPPKPVSKARRKLLKSRFLSISTKVTWEAISKFVKNRLFSTFCRIFAVFSCDLGGKNGENPKKRRKSPNLHEFGDFFSHDFCRNRQKASSYEQKTCFSYILRKTVLFYLLAPQF